MNVKDIEVGAYYRNTDWKDCIYLGVGSRKCDAIGIAWGNIVTQKGLIVISFGIDHGFKCTSHKRNKSFWNHVEKISSEEARKFILNKLEA